MNQSKRTTYSEGIAKIDQALREQFYLEASWIEYAMFEDRCDSMLEKSGGKPALNNGRHFISINRKICELRSRGRTHPFLISVTDFDALLQELHDWKERRNPIMHSLVEVPKSWSDINNETKLLAEDGRKLLGRVAAAAMSVRKKYKKADN